MVAESDDVKRALADWARAAGCRLLVLFGSHAAATASDSSDVDLAVSFAEPSPPLRRLAMIGQIEDICRRRVDVVFLDHRTNPVLRFEIFRGGTPLYEAQPGLFVDGAARALFAYDDALPFRRALRDSLIRTRSGSP